MIMKTHFLMLTFLISAQIFYAQFLFDQGYIINNNNERIDCLIKNIDWKDKPKIFEYKLNENDVETNGSTDNIREFGVLDESRFVRA